MKKLTITSSAFQEGRTIPSRFACTAENLSPELNWTDPPEGCVTFALICDDPDAPAGVFDHWLVANIDGNLRRLPEGIGKATTLPAGAVEGKNGFGNVAYGGPCPPPGKPHRYFFKIYALNANLTLPDRFGKSQLEAAMKNHILAEGQLMGKFSR